MYTMDRRFIHVRIALSFQRIGHRLKTWILLASGICFIMLTTGVEKQSFDPGEALNETQLGSSFQYIWVTQTDIHTIKPSNESCIEVAATAVVNKNAFNQGSRLVYLLVRYMPDDIFTLVAKAIKVGIFNSNEFPCDFPEYAPVNTECKYACPDHCSTFCDNGIPIAMKWSHPGTRLVVTAGNLLCGQDGQFDPEFGRMNLLVHDFAESLVKYVLPTDVVDNIITAYNSSKLTWDLHPSNHINYFRQGTAAWFRATSKPSYDTGGMTICSDARPCGTEGDLRRNILTRDAPLFDILSSVYTHERWNLTGDISVCTW